MESMLAKFATLWPEIALLVGATVCLITGLHPVAAVRRATVWVAVTALVVAGLLIGVVGVPYSEFGLGAITIYVKYAVVGVGVLLLLVAAGVPGQLKQNRLGETSARFEPGNVTRGEFFAFFLLSLVGVMVTAAADDLVWLFLALELTSLPTYVMVATARDRISAQESAVKYFFLGAMSAAVFLYGFTLIYGATGVTSFVEIQAIAREQLASPGGLSPLLLAGLVLAVLGICFKIAAFPMHFYAADVYQGAATPVSAMLAFVPKAAGFVALVLLLSLVGWPLPGVLVGLLWGIAAITMTVGNVLALLQTNVKRVLAYSSIAHSGYMVVGLIAGPGTHSLGNGLAAVLFYLVAYGLATLAAFGVLGCLRARGDEGETYDDLAGLRHRSPMLAGILVLSVISLLGLPPLVGFLGKLYLIGAAYTAAFPGYIALIVLLVLNSAISAAYYLAIANVAFFGKPSPQVTLADAPLRGTATGVAAVLAVVLGLAGLPLVTAAHHATIGTQSTSPVRTQHDPLDATAAADARDAAATALRSD